MARKSSSKNVPPSGLRGHMGGLMIAAFVAAILLFSQTQRSPVPVGRETTSSGDLLGVPPVLYREGDPIYPGVQSKRMTDAGRTTTKFVVLSHTYNLFPIHPDLVDQLVAAINAEKPDYVFLLGDHNNRRTEYEWENVQETFLKKIDAPIYIAPGNHEFLDNGQRAIVDVYNTTRASPYMRTVGHLYNLLETPEAAFIFIPSSDYLENIAAYLSGTLLKIPKDKPTFLMSHHRVWSEKNPLTREMFAKFSGDDLLPFIEGKVDYILGGDVASAFAERTWKGMKVFTVGMDLSGMGHPIYYTVGEIGSGGTLSMEPKILPIPEDHSWYTVKWEWPKDLPSLNSLTWWPKKGMMYDRKSSDAVRFAVIGDYGVPSAEVDQIVKMIKSWKPDFIVTTGDNLYVLPTQKAYEDIVGARFGDYIGPSGSGAKTVGNRFFPALGNHDYAGDPDGYAAYLDYFDLPGVPGNTSGNERYYNVRQGDAEFFILNSDWEPDGSSATSKQAQWLQKALADSTALWKFVVIHRPPYTTEARGSHERFQWPFKEWGADAVFSGHSHLYERVVLDDFPYFINGFGGAATQAFGTGAVAGSRIRYSDYKGAQLVTLTGSQAVIEFYSVEQMGSLIDWYVLHKNL